jgi:hypothetical protein
MRDRVRVQARSHQLPSPTSPEKGAGLPAPEGSSSPAIKELEAPGGAAELVESGSRVRKSERTAWKTRQLLVLATNVRTDVRTGLSPPPASCCNSLLLPFAPVSLRRPLLSPTVVVKVVNEQERRLASTPLPDLRSIYAETTQQTPRDRPRSQPRSRASIASPRTRRTPAQSPAALPSSRKPLRAVPSVEGSNLSPSVLPFGKAALLSGNSRVGRRTIDAFVEQHAIRARPRQT